MSRISSLIENIGDKGSFEGKGIKQQTIKDLEICLNILNKYSNQTRKESILTEVDRLSIVKCSVTVWDIVNILKGEPSDLDLDI